MEKDKGYNGIFNNKLTSVEQMVVAEYLSGKSIYRVAKEQHYDNDYMCHQFRKAITKLATASEDK